MTDSELAVLGLVVERPRHGYEIEQVIEERGMREWTAIGFSSIYYVLTKLEKAGHVTAATDNVPGKGPSRKVYSATHEGHGAFVEASLAALATPAGGNRPFLLGVSALAALPDEEALTAVSAYRDAIEVRLRHVRERREAAGDAPWFVDALFDYSVEMLDAERAWIARFLKRMEKERTVGVVPKKMKPLVPELVELPGRRMAAAHTIGDPVDVLPQVFPALYGAVYTLKFALKKQGVEFKAEPPRGRWFGGPDWQSAPRDQWEAAWAIPVPEDTAEVVQKDPDMPVTLETWEYGTVAQVLHVGSYAEEEPTITLLHDFIAGQGYEIAGPHEEEYLSRPDAKAPKTIIRYQVRKRG